MSSQIYLAWRSFLFREIRLAIGFGPAIPVVMLNYFAYGSNINPGHISSFLRSHGVDPDHISKVRRALLSGYRLRTNYMTAGRGAAANIEPTNGCSVEGVVMEISESVRDALRTKEGWPFRYEEVPVRVRLRNGWMADAFTYVVTRDMRVPWDLPVSKRYRALIIDGARAYGFTHRYQHQLHVLLKTA